VFSLEPAWILGFARRYWARRQKSGLRVSVRLVIGGGVLPEGKQSGNSNPRS